MKKKNIKAYIIFFIIHGKTKSSSYTTSTNSKSLSMRNRKKCLSWSTIVEKMKNQKKQKEENIHSQEPGKFPKNCSNNNNEANTIINNLGAGEKKKRKKIKKIIRIL